MIYATHRLYDSATSFMPKHTIETQNGVVSRFYPFDCEKHSMQWYDAVILSPFVLSDGFYHDFENMLLRIAADSMSQIIPLHAYGINFEEDGFFFYSLR